MSDSLQRRNTFSRLLDKAVRILAMRDCSEQELRRKLSAPSPFTSSTLSDSDFNKEDPAILVKEIDRVIAYCYEHRWLDDANFAARYIASRGRKGYGLQRIRQELQQKGVARELCDIAIESSDIDWQQIAVEVAVRKFGQPLPTEWHTRAKLQRFLLYRGFFMEEIQAIYRNFTD